MPEISPSDVVAFDSAIRIDQERQVRQHQPPGISDHQQTRQADRPAGVFELGTFDGLTTLGIAANAPDSARILTLDLPEDWLADTRFELCD